MSCSHVVADEVARGNFEDTGPDRDWGDRNEALLALQRLFDEAAKIAETDDGTMLARFIAFMDDTQTLGAADVAAVTEFCLGIQDYCKKLDIDTDIDNDIQAILEWGLARHHYL